MNTTANDPEKDQDQKEEMGDTPGIETHGPGKDQDFKVLNKDGSLPDLPDGKDKAGNGALEGTVGLGT